MEMDICRVTTVTLVAIALPDMGGLKAHYGAYMSHNCNVAIALPDMGGLKAAIKVPLDVATDLSL